MTLCVVFDSEQSLPQASSAKHSLLLAGLSEKIFTRLKNLHLDENQSVHGTSHERNMAILGFLKHIPSVIGQARSLE